MAGKKDMVSNSDMRLIYALCNYKKINFDPYTHKSHRKYFDSLEDKELIPLYGWVKNKDVSPMYKNFDPNKNLPLRKPLKIKKAVLKNLNTDSVQSNMTKFFGSLKKKGLIEVSARNATDDKGRKTKGEGKYVRRLKRDFPTFIRLYVYFASRNLVNEFVFSDYFDDVWIEVTLIQKDFLQSLNLQEYLYDSNILRILGKTNLFEYYLLDKKQFQQGYDLIESTIETKSAEFQKDFIKTAFLMKTLDPRITSAQKALFIKGYGALDDDTITFNIESEKEKMLRFEIAASKRLIAAENLKKEKEFIKKHGGKR